MKFLDTAPGQTGPHAHFRGPTHVCQIFYEVKVSKQGHMHTLGGPHTCAKYFMRSKFPSKNKKNISEQTVDGMHYCN